MRPSPVIAHRASLAHFVSDPEICGEKACEFFEDGLLVIGESGIVVEAGAAESLREKYAGVPVVAHKNTLLSPGFVDAHIHFPQVDAIACGGGDLLEWLNRHTFPAEAAFADADYAAEMAEFFLAELLANGTTTALVFASSHKCSADALFARAREKNMRLIAGKVLMDRNAPPELCDTAESGARESRELIRQWHGAGRLGYAVTPRFAPTSTSEQLHKAGELLAEFPDVLLHTHLSENRRELDFVRELFPGEGDYLSVYERRGLVCERSVFAHAIHLGGDEWRRISARGCALAHCPLSNFFLGSGLFDFARARELRMRIGLGSDVGGGNSFCILRAMEEAYKTARMRGDNLTGMQMWHAATLGGAAALRLDSHIGNFLPGKEADFVALDFAAHPLLARRWQQSQTPEEKLFALAMLSERPTIKNAYILGELAN